MMESKESRFTPELIEKARQTESPEELLALAQENGITFSEDEAEDYFAQLQESCNKSGELSDDELDNVSGGGCYYKDGRLVVTAGYECYRYRCKKCGSPDTHPGYIVLTDLNPCHCDRTCSGCKYKSNKGIRMLCNHPENYKK
ncbi:MAG: Nif11-like leader peptide family RiPP precursor [Oscillospiraceae bacterium]|nr:Nif11-like leader peptide family RiPP precursor [Oscillospiraceae bacterium]